MADSIRISKVKFAGLALLAAATLSAGFASPAGAAHYFGTYAYSAGQAPGYFSVQKTTGYYSMSSSGGSVVTGLSSGTATLCATQTYGYAQKIVVQWNAYKWNYATGSWTAVYSNFAQANVSAGGCTTFAPGWTFEREGSDNMPVSGLHTVEWKAWWATAGGTLLAYQGDTLDDLADYQRGGDYANMLSVRMVAGRAAICVAFYCS